MTPSSAALLESLRRRFDHGLKLRGRTGVAGPEVEVTGKKGGVLAALMG
jgi:hypothetical protein